MPAALPGPPFARNPEPHSALLSGRQGRQDQGPQGPHRNARHPAQYAANAGLTGSRAPSIVLVGLHEGTGRRGCDVTDCESLTDMGGDKSHMHTPGIDEPLLVNY